MTRDEMIEVLAQKWTDEMDVDALMEFFFNEQVKFLEDLTDEDLLNEAKENGIQN